MVPPRCPPNVEQTTYEMVWPDGRREEIVGRTAILRQAVGDAPELVEILK